MDYAVAVHDTDMIPMPVEIICFQCQQAAEKAMKSVLAYLKQDIPRTHDLSRLWALCEPLVTDLPDMSKECVELSGYAVATRYPDSVELDEHDMREALDCAKTVIENVSAWLESQPREWGDGAVDGKSAKLTEKDARIAELMARLAKAEGSAPKWKPPGDGMEMDAFTRKDR
jgi:HEPN domain-containing protein